MEKNYDDLQIDEVHCNNGVFRVMWSMPFAEELAYLGDQLGYVDLIVANGAVEIQDENMSQEFCQALMIKLVEKYYKGPR